MAQRFSSTITQRLMCLNAQVPPPVFTRLPEFTKSVFCLPTPDPAQQRLRTAGFAGEQGPEAQRKTQQNKQPRVCGDSGEELEKDTQEKASSPLPKTRSVTPRLLWGAGNLPSISQGSRRQHHSFALWNHYVSWQPLDPACSPGLGGRTEQGAGRRPGGGQDQGVSHLSRVFWGAHGRRRPGLRVLQGEACT